MEYIFQLNHTDDLNNHVLMWKNNSMLLCMFSVCSLYVLCVLLPHVCFICKTAACFINFLILFIYVSICVFLYTLCTVFPMIILVRLFSLTFNCMLWYSMQEMIYSYSGWEIHITNLLFIPAHKVGVGGYCHYYVWLWLCASMFCFRMISRKPLAGMFSYHIHTSLRGCRCAFWGL